MSLRVSLSEYQAAFQGELFPALEEALGPLPERYGRFVQVLEFVLVDAVVLPLAFLAKAVFDVPTTRALIERLQIDGPLRRLCGWTRAGAVPSEATFSRAFAAFAASGLPERLHASLVAKTLGHRLVGHISRDATAIPAREKPPPKHRRGRPRKGEERPPRRRRLERQQEMTLADLPQACDVGTKRTAKGYQSSFPLSRMRNYAAASAVCQWPMVMCPLRHRSVPITILLPALDQPVLGQLLPDGARDGPRVRLAVHRHPAELFRDAGRVHLTAAVLQQCLQELYFEARR